MDYVKFRNKSDDTSCIADDKKGNAPSETNGDTKCAPQRFIDLKEILRRQPYKRTSIFRKVRTGDFPTPIKIGPNRTAWLESEFEQWLEERIRRRSAADNEHRRSDPEGA